MSKIVVVKQNRFNNSANIKKTIDENRFGKIYLILVNVYGIG